MSDRYLAYGPTGDPTGVEATSTSTGSAQAGDIVALNGDGYLDSSLFASLDLSNNVIVDVDCDSSVYITAAVRMNSGVAYNALADSLANSNIIGIVESKSSTTKCTIRFFGVGIEIFSGLDETKEYFLSDTVAGAITTTVPTDSGHVVLRVGQPFSATRFLFIKGLAMERA